MLPEHALARGLSAPGETSETKVVLRAPAYQWVRPAEGEVFHIDSRAGFPEIRFEVTGAPASRFEWHWRIAWDAAVSGLRERPRGKVIRSFNATGTSSTSEPRWLASLDGHVLGGTLVVELEVEGEVLVRTVSIRCVNPSEAEIVAHLATLANVEGFEKIIEKESRFRHVLQTDEEPVVAFDGGYGLTQLTNPPPAFEEVWNWKMNVEAGAALYQEKQRAARAYLGRSGRTFTANQLRLETWSRWNGGAYHVWDPGEAAWIRNPNIVCAAGTGNIGWDVRATGNNGLTPVQLDARDRNTFASPASRRAENQWRYFGVCYADSLESS